MKKIILITLLSICINFITVGQCIHLYRCSGCAKTTRGKSSPNGGEHYDDFYKKMKRCHWEDQGIDDPECERLQAEREAKEEALRNKVYAEYEKNKIKTYKGGNVIDWHFPSGKPLEVKYSNGIIERYSESGILTQKKTPSNGNYYCENYENGKLVSKGNLNTNNEEDGEWYYVKFSKWEGDNCNNCTVTFEKGEYLGIGTKNEIIEKKSFESCSTLENYQNFRKKYPNSIFDSKALIKINELKKEAEQEAIAKQKFEEEKAYVLPLIEKWNTIEDKPSVVDSYWAEYLRKYPDGEYLPRIQAVIDNIHNNIKLTKEYCNCDYNNLNKMNSSKGELEFDYSIAMEIKQKFGINIFRYMNYGKRYDNSFQFIEYYPNLELVDDLNVVNKFKSNESLTYQIKNGVLANITIEYRGKDVVRKSIFTFHENGKVKTYTFLWRDLNSYESNKIVLKFDNNGQLLNGGDYNNLNLEMFN